MTNWLSMKYCFCLKDQATLRSMGLTNKALHSWTWHDQDLLRPQICNPRAAMSLCPKVGGGLFPDTCVWPSCWGSWNVCYLHSFLPMSSRPESACLSPAYAVSIPRSVLRQQCRKRLKEFRWQAFTRRWPHNWQSPSGSPQPSFWRRDATEMAMHQLCTSAVHMLHFLHLLNYAFEKTAEIILTTSNLPFSLPSSSHCLPWKLSIHRIRGYGWRLWPSAVA